MSCPRTLPRKNPEDPVRLESRTPGLRVKHFTTEPRRTHVIHEDPPAEKEYRQPGSTLPSQTEEPAEKVQETSSDEPVKDTTAFRTETPPTAMMTTLQERALALLTTGAMPFLQPARRDWMSGVEIQLPIQGSLSMCPQAGWKTMSADVKLLWDTVSTLLATLVFQAIPEDRSLLSILSSFLHPWY